MEDRTCRFMVHDLGLMSVHQWAVSYLWVPSHVELEGNEGS